MKFPVLAEFIGEFTVPSVGFIVLFNSPSNGFVIYSESGGYKIGHHCNCWMRVDGIKNWRILDGLDSPVVLL